MTRSSLASSAPARFVPPPPPPRLPQLSIDPNWRAFAPLQPQPPPRGLREPQGAQTAGRALAVALAAAPGGPPAAPGREQERRSRGGGEAQR